MSAAKKPRHRRTDRNHILYRLENIKTGQFYIGMSGCIGRKVTGTLKRRFGRHLSKAITESHDWMLHKALRKDPDQAIWKKEVLSVVRGRRAARLAERALILSLHPPLNTAIY